MLSRSSMSELIKLNTKFASNFKDLVLNSRNLTAWKIATVYRMNTKIENISFFLILYKINQEYIWLLNLVQN